jgi:hypothetical protein
MSTDVRSGEQANFTAGKRNCGNTKSSCDLLIPNFGNEFIVAGMRRDVVTVTQFLS